VLLFGHMGKKTWSAGPYTWSAGGKTAPHHFA